jgi:hypothetical protein
MTQYFFDGDPATDSTRRHLERVLKQPQKHRWTWVAAMVAGGAVFTFWRSRRRPQKPPAARSSGRHES